MTRKHQQTTEQTKLKESGVILIMTNHFKEAGKGQT